MSLLFIAVFIVFVGEERLVKMRKSGAVCVLTLDALHSRKNFRQNLTRALFNIIAKDLSECILHLFSLDF